jgi:hypothetical protein
MSFDFTHADILADLINLLTPAMARAEACDANTSYLVTVRHPMEPNTPVELRSLEQVAAFIREHCERG